MFIVIHKNGFSVLGYFTKREDNPSLRQDYILKGAAEFREIIY